MTISQITKRPFSFILAVCIMVFSISFGGCKADIDLKDIDTKAELNMGFAMPIGTMNVTLKDLLGNGQIEHLYIDSADQRGVLVYKDTFLIERTFHQIDLSQYISETSLTLNVYDKLKDLPFMADHKITGNSNLPIRLDFPMTLRLSGINDDVSNERLDSVLVKNANFISNISQQDLPLEWEWIDEISLELSDNFSRPQGKVMPVYKKGDGKGYNTDIHILVDEFLLNLMKDKKPSDYEHNVESECNFTIHFDFTIPTEAGEVYVPDDAAFNYNLKVQFIDYYAIWGMFTPSNEMYDEDMISLADTWDNWTLFRDAKLPFADPTIDMYITTHIAGALKMQGDYLYVKENATDTKIHATFDGDTTLYKHFTPNEYLPLTSPIGDSTKVLVKFDKDPARGHIDRLFSVRPDYLGYKFLIDFDRAATPQIRITNNTNVRVDAVYTLPFVFNQDVSLHYTDTLQNIDLGNMTLDSLFVSERIDSVKTNDLKLFVKLQNTIPLQIKAVLRCLDAQGNIVTDPNDPSQPLRISTADTMLIPAPQYTFNGGTWAMIAPGEVQSILSINQCDFNRFDDVKHIMIEAIMDDQSLQYAYEQGNFNVKLTEDQKLRINIGIAANIDATLDLGEKEQQ